ncbi:MAG TPA: MotA/TolQ/ExbB proton channel family protein [Polyangiales bacterium]|nr:MotA/TolQ/ExbB proton channel family protein [Polyangiales bacterium]
MRQQNRLWHEPPRSAGGPTTFRAKGIMDIQQRMTAFALLGATWVMWLLVGLSVVSVAIMLERAYFFAVTRDDIDALRKELLDALRRGDLAAARKRMQSSRSFEASLVMSGLDSAADGAPAAAERIIGEEKIARLRMERNLAFLGTVGNNAPFVGLLGTVIGIIRAFHSLDESKGQVTAGLMMDIGEALVATAIGIMVAIPAVAAFNYGQRLIKTRLSRGSALASDVVSHLLSTRHQDQSAAAE